MPLAEANQSFVAEANQLFIPVISLDAISQS
jgi:hypothetical protein